MAKPITPQKPSSPEPCQRCGHPVRIEQQPLARTNDETSASTASTRVCTNPGCSTNSGTRRLDEVP